MLEPPPPPPEDELPEELPPPPDDPPPLPLPPPPDDEEAEGDAEEVAVGVAEDDGEALGAITSPTVTSSEELEVLPFLLTEVIAVTVNMAFAPLVKVVKLAVVSLGDAVITVPEFTSLTT